MNNIDNISLTDKLIEIDTLNNSDFNTTSTTLNTINNENTNLHYCPHCGESYYRVDYSTSTCIYFPPIYKNGVNINPDKNKSTTHCTCINCGKTFPY